MNDTQTEMCTLLAQNPAVSIRLLSKTDPDPTVNEKFDFIQALLSRNPGVFVQRYGQFLIPAHLDFMEATYQSPEVTLEVKLVRESRDTTKAKLRIRNRRFQKMQQLLGEGKYFTDDETQHRAPWMFYEYVGRYVSDREAELMAKEKTQASWTAVLLDQIDNQELRDRIEEERIKYSRGISRKNMNEANAGVADQYNYGVGDQEEDEEDEEDEEPKDEEEEEEVEIDYKSKREKEEEEEALSLANQVDGMNDMEKLQALQALQAQAQAQAYHHPYNVSARVNDDDNISEHDSDDDDSDQHRHAGGSKSYQYPFPVNTKPILTSFATSAPATTRPNTTTAATATATTTAGPRSNSHVHFSSSTNKLSTTSSTAKPSTSILKSNSAVGNKSLQTSISAQKNRTEKHLAASDTSMDIDKADADVDVDADIDADVAHKRKVRLLEKEPRKEFFHRSFLDAMCERFLRGEDTEYIDYNTIDASDTLDDLRAMARDAEEKYFDEEEEAIDKSKQSHGQHSTATQAPMDEGKDINQDPNDDEDDYMKFDLSTLE